MGAHRARGADDPRGDRRQRRARGRHRARGVVTIGPQAAEGFLHTFSGWLVFVVAFCVLMACARLLARFPAAGRPRSPVGSS